MVKLKLNENYSNQFLTTDMGVAFYKNWKEQNRPEYVEVSDDDYKTKEMQNLVRQKILILKEEKKVSKKIEEPESKKIE